MEWLRGAKNRADRQFDYYRHFVYKRGQQSRLSVLNANHQHAINTLLNRGIRRKRAGKCTRGAWLNLNQAFITTAEPVFAVGRELDK